MKREEFKLLVNGDVTYRALAAVLIINECLYKASYDVKDNHVVFSIEAPENFDFFDLLIDGIDLYIKGVVSDSELKRVCNKRKKQTKINTYLCIKCHKVFLNTMKGCLSR